MTRNDSQPNSDDTGQYAADDRIRPDGGRENAETAEQSSNGGGTTDAPDIGDRYTAQTGGTYIESTIIMTTVRVVAPFVMTFGLFVTLHGADSPGGGFQGGVVLASVLVMIAFAYGTAPTRDWIKPTAIGGLIGGGVLLFAVIGLGTLALGGSFLEYVLYGGKTASKYGIELVELGIGATVVGVVTSIFFVLARGFEAVVDEGGEV